jgi:hypothetical protein
VQNVTVALIKLNDTHTQTRIHTLGRILLDEWSAHRKDLYITHNTHSSQTSILPAGFEPVIPASVRQQAYSVDHAATGKGYSHIYHKVTYVLWCLLQFTLYFRFCIQICLLLFPCSYVIICYYSMALTLDFVQVHEIECCSYSTTMRTGLPIYISLKVFIGGRDSVVVISTRPGSKPAERVVRDFVSSAPV